MKRRDDRDEEVKPIARQIEQLARAPQYAPRGYRIGDYGNHTERQLLFRVSVVASAVACAHATISRRDALAGHSTRRQLDLLHTSKVRGSRRFTVMASHSDL